MNTFYYWRSYLQAGHAVHADKITLEVMHVTDLASFISLHTPIAAAQVRFCRSCHFIISLFVLPLTVWDAVRRKRAVWRIVSIILLTW